MDSVSFELKTHCMLCGKLIGTVQTSWLREDYERHLAAHGGEIPRSHATCLRCQLHCPRVGCENVGSGLQVMSAGRVLTIECSRCGLMFHVLDPDRDKVAK